MKMSQPLLKARFLAPVTFIIFNSLVVYFSMPAVTVGCKNSSSPVTHFSLTFQPIPYEEEDIIAPGRGAEQWHDQNKVKLPADTSTAKRLDKYYRFSWKDLETGNGKYNWSLFDQEINDAIANRQKFSFGIMPAYPGGASNLTVNGATLFYPVYLHEQMQSEEAKDWISPLAKMWVPNWNSKFYLEALERLNEAINNHLDSGSYTGIRYKNVINYIDIRGYGSWGEWHSHEIVEHVSDYPAGTRATAASLKRIIDAHVKKYLDYPLVIMFNAFDCNRLNNTKTPDEVAYHALTVKNNWGLIGWRRDNWGALDDYIRQYTDKNRIVFNDVRMDTAIMNRFKYAPVNGEPIPVGSLSGGCEYGDLEAQVKRYHASSFGNGNFSDDSKPCMQNNIRAASKAAGYRLILEGGDISPVVNSGQPFFIMLQWKNIGVAPTYENWDVYFELKDSSNNLVWSEKSQFKPKLFIPESVGVSILDQYVLPSKIPAGNYRLDLIIKDPVNYRDPLPLAIRGRKQDGSYTITTLTVSSKQEVR
jgi:hypothetical protein